MAAITDGSAARAPAALRMGQRSNIVRDARLPDVSLDRTNPDRRDLQLVLPLPDPFLRNLSDGCGSTTPVLQSARKTSGDNRSLRKDRFCVCRRINLGFPRSCRDAPRCSFGI
jgi:hypothetical protein